MTHVPTPPTPEGAAHSLQIRLVRGDQTLTQTVTPAYTEDVPTRWFKAELLAEFGEGSALYDLEAETDENDSWELRGIDHLGQSHSLEETPTLDLSNWAAFVATPQTRLG